VTTNDDEDSNVESIGDNQGNDDDNEDDSDDGSGNEEAETMYNPDTWTPSVQRVHGLHPWKGSDFSHLRAAVVYHGMTQYSLKKGLKKLKQ
jgi:hypothetical protein